MGNNEFETLAKTCVLDWYTNNKKDEGVPEYEQIYAVWLCKILQNNKALLSTTLKDHMYFEVTYNGDMNELYVDAYDKVSNTVIKRL